MTTDFTYGNKTITTSGPTKPATKNSPGDVRTRVQTYADISTIPMPYIGMPIVVLTDETNENKMTEYRVKSLKANTLGVQDTVVNEVVRLKDFLEISNSGNVSQEDIKAAVNDYLEENPVQSGATAEQAAQIQVAYQHSQSPHVQASDISGLQPKTDNTLTTTDKTIVGAINEIKNSIVSEIPVYSLDDFGKVLAVDSSGNSLTWVEVSNTGSLSMRDVVDGEVFIKGTSSTPTVTYGNIVTSNTTLTVDEEANATFTVKLDKAPTNNQVVNIAVNNSYCTVNPSSLTFTPSNYSENQTVTVNGVHDSSNYTNKASVITLSSTSVTNKTINVTINNIDEQPSETIPVQSITLNKTESTLNVGDSEQLTVTFNPSNATNQNVTWASNNNEIATVVSGLVTANASGNVTISVTSEDGNKTASCSYTVQESSTTDPDPDQPTDESMVLFVNNTLSKEATAEDKTNILTDHTNNHTVQATSTNTNPSFVPKIISDDGTAIQFVNGTDTGYLTVLNSGKLTSLNNTVEIYFESTDDIGSVLISIYDNRGLTTNNSGGQLLRISNNRIVFGDGGSLYIDISTTIEPNIKYHLVAVSDFDNKKAYIYLNGVKLTENTATTFHEIKEHNVRLGEPVKDNIKYYYFKVYNRALSESEIQTKYEGVN